MNYKNSIPFIGHVGQGSRFRFRKTNSRIVISESIVSQAFLIVSLLLFGPGINLILFFKAHEKPNTPVFILVVINLFSLVGWIFGIKYLLRLIRFRRIEISSNGDILLFKTKALTERTIQKKDIMKIEIEQTLFRGISDDHSSNAMDNFSIVVTLKDSEKVYLCTGDSKKNVDSVFNQIKKLN